ncbi:MAG: hypothetical protein IT428_32260 [Planctomycetaceae bacterium]|nr:hypothetical protein [Planctomycetaceae bacterium]
MNETHRFRLLPPILCLVLVGLYVGAYYSTVTPIWEIGEVVYPRFHGPLINSADMSSWQRWKMFFAPVHWLDRRIRRFYWRPLEMWESP